MADSDPKITGRLFVVSGPSGSGKSTLCRTLCEQSDVRLSISATTRPAGKNEVDGRDYYFMSESDFLRDAEAGKFLEHASVFNHYYGTPAEPVRAMLTQGDDVILEIDIQGAEQVFDKCPQAIGILILPPDTEELRKRLRKRGREDDEVIERRLAKAQYEVDRAQSLGRYQYTIVNDQLDRALSEFATVIKNSTQPHEI